MNNVEVVDQSKRENGVRNNTENPVIYCCWKRLNFIIFYLILLFFISDEKNCLKRDIENSSFSIFTIEHCFYFRYVRIRSVHSACWHQFKLVNIISPIFLDFSAFLSIPIWLFSFLLKVIRSYQKLLIISYNLLIIYCIHAIVSDLMDRIGSCANVCE